MKRSILIFQFILCAILAHAQTDGLSYQAVILDNNDHEIPGLDVSGNYLSNGEVTMRFTIYNVNEGIDYQEVHFTTTDAFGMINVIIGQGQSTSESMYFFDEIDWDGTPKDLTVELSYDAVDFEELSRQALLFLPYAYHRNITATGTLTVDQETLLKGNLTVDLETQLNSQLTVEEETLLKSDLTVEGDAFFQGNTTFTDIVVENNSDLQGDVQVGGSFNVNNSSPANFTGLLTVDGNAIFNGQANHFYGANTSVHGAFITNGAASLNGQVTINAGTTGGQSAYSAYGLRVQGTDQGIAIKLNGSRGASKNYTTFMDGSGTIHGRIEGQTYSELTSSFRFIWDYVMAGIETAMIAAEGVACGVQLDWGESGVMAAGFLTKGAQWVELSHYHESNVGVYFSSGGADYAEWLEREDPLTNFHPGEVVGIYAGKISRNTQGAHEIKVISTNPIVLGNQPKEGQEHLYERVGFLGQVPVRVIGKVNEGDYILPSGENDGLAKAYNPVDLPTHMFNEIIGIAWQSGDNLTMNLINMAVGLNTNDLASRVSNMEKELAEIKRMLKGEISTDQMDNSEQEVTSNNSTISSPSITKSAMTPKMTDEEFEKWVNDYGYIFEETMTRVKSDLLAKGSEYTQYPEIAKIN